jgi:hypothetical protein
VKWRNLSTKDLFSVTWHGKFFKFGPYHWPSSICTLIASYIQLYFVCSGISKLETISEEVIVVYFKVLPYHLPGETGKPSKSLVRMACVTVSIQTGCLLNMNPIIISWVNFLGWLDIRGFISSYLFVWYPSSWNVELNYSSLSYISNYFIFFVSVSRRWQNTV